MHALLALTLLASIDLGAARHAFAELDAMCAADGGRLWGRPVCGPVVFVEPESREAVRRTDGNLETVSVPASIGIANTAVLWDGRRWTMVMWPLPQDPVARRALLAHEAFHRLQPDLGLPMNDPRNAHLDTADARTWMRFEWRALARALATGDAAAVRDALAFRAQRRARFPGAAEEERRLEMHEGLAEHTGYALAVPFVRERVASLVKKLAAAEAGESYARSFAYTSGPAWGALIEMKDPRWTRHLSASDDLGAVARRVWHIEKVDASRIDAYGGDAVRAEEAARSEKRRAWIAAARGKFVDGPVLTIPLRQMQFTFDPNRVQPLEDAGTIYQTMEVRDVWGTITVQSGGLIAPDFSKLVVPADGSGWVLTLAEGWEVSGHQVRRKASDER